MKKKITCDICGETYAYESSGENDEAADNLPDGYFVPDYKRKVWLWICDKCGSCPDCVKSLEKEPEKRATKETPALCCDECRPSN